MYGRRNHRKRGFKRVVVTLLSLVMLVSVCFPGLRASAEGTEIQVTQGGNAEYTDVTDVYAVIGYTPENVGLRFSASESGTILVEATENAVVGTHQVTVTYNSIVADPSEESEEPSEQDESGNTAEPVLEQKTATFTVNVAVKQSDVAGDIEPYADSDSLGSVGHIEVIVNAIATLQVEGMTDVTANVALTTDDQFTITATQNGKSFGDFTVSTRRKYDSDNNNNRTVRIYGVYPVGTKDNPVRYTVSVVKTVTFTLADGSTHTDDVTLSITGGFWDDINACPGTYGQNGKRQTWWTNGEFKGGLGDMDPGMDFPISGTAVGTAITKGKLAISKEVLNDDSAEVFQFVLQNNSTKKYLTFSNNAYTGESDTQTEACVIKVTAGSSVVLTGIPVGIYKVTELQKDGFIVTDVDGKYTGNYSLDYTIENKEDSSIPVAKFTNKKLIDDAGISIRKIASGLENTTIGYPSPTVRIYAVGSDGLKTGEPVWTGSLVANGDTLYLKATLPAGTYVIEESGQEVARYRCTTTLTGVQTDGFTFTVEAGNRYDLVVNNVYTEIPPESEDEVYIQVQKTFVGLTEEQLNALIANTNDPFTITVTDENGNTYPLTLTDAGVERNGFTFTWILSGLSAGTYSVTESGENIEKYNVTTTGTGTEVTTLPSAIAFSTTSEQTSCSGKTWVVGTVNFIVVKLTGADKYDYFIWTQNSLSANKRQAIVDFINTKKNDSGLGYNPEASITNCAFFSGDKLTDDDGLYFRDGYIRYDKTTGKLTFDGSNQWAMFAAGTYTVTDNKSEISVTNTYTRATTNVAVTKTVSGNLGDWSKQFSFIASMKDADGNDVSMNGVTYTLYQKNARGDYEAVENGSGVFTDVNASFTLKHDQKIVLSGVPIGATITIAETDTDYTESYRIDNNTPVEGTTAFFTVGENGNTVAFDNYLNVNIETGITADYVPFVVLLLVSVVGAGVLLLNKRRYTGKF